MAASRNEHTLAPIFSNARSGEAQHNYDNGYDRIFGPRPKRLDEKGGRTRDEDAGWSEVVDRRGGGHDAAPD